MSRKLIDSGLPRRNLVESGVSWIGKIPEGWRLGRLKDCTSVILGKMLCSVQQDESQTLENYLCAGNIKWDGVDTTYIKQMWFSEEEKNLYLLKPGDLLTMEGGSVGTSCIYRGEFAPCYIQNSVQKICAENNAWTKFLFYWMFVVQSSGYIDAISNKATIQHYTKEKILRTPAVIPPLAEQQRIAAFLDRECEKIDGLRGKIEKQIEKLDELKKSTITEAVTGKIGVGGRCRSRKMKPSGVEWIGDIPEAWKVTPLKFVSNKIGSGKTPLGGATVYQDEGVMFLRSQNVYDEGLFLDDVQFISEAINSDMLSTRVCCGDILLNITGGSIGRCCVYQLSIDANVNQHVCIIRVDHARMINRFVRYFINGFRNEIVGKNQEGANRESLNFEQIGNMRVPNPPLAEQKEIAEYLDKKCAAIDAAKEKCRVQLEKLAEYKKSLIYEYVTGKKEVA